MRALVITAFLGLGALAVACGSGGEEAPAPEDAGTTDGSVRDAAATDARADASQDAGSDDARPDARADGGSDGGPDAGPR